MGILTAAIVVNATNIKRKRKGAKIPGGVQARKIHKRKRRKENCFAVEIVKNAVENRLKVVYPVAEKPLNRDEEVSHTKLVYSIAHMNSQNSQTLNLGI